MSLKKGVEFCGGKKKSVPAVRKHSNLEHIVHYSFKPMDIANVCICTKSWERNKMVKENALEGKSE